MNGCKVVSPINCVCTPTHIITLIVHLLFNSEVWWMRLLRYYLLSTHTSLVHIVQPPTVVFSAHIFCLTLLYKNWVERSWKKKKKKKIKAKAKQPKILQTFWKYQKPLYEPSLVKEIKTHRVNLRRNIE